MTKEAGLVIEHILIDVPGCERNFDICRMPSSELAPINTYRGSQKILWQNEFINQSISLYLILPRYKSEGDRE